MGPERGEASTAEVVARQWLARYGVVSRDWWRRERPPVEWRMIYRELKRLEFRGEVRRGYFVSGLAGAQFALPEAVELLRAAPADDIVAMAASDPANVYSLPLAEGVGRDSLSRPRGAGAVLVTVAGDVVLAAEGRGKRIRIRESNELPLVARALQALVTRLQPPERGARRRDIVVETINGEAAGASPLAPAFLDAGFRRQPGGLRRYGSEST
jgi:ATP-dependent Lhr-like helicase